MTSPCPNISPSSNDLTRTLLIMHLEVDQEAVLPVTGWSMGSLMGPAAQLCIRPIMGMPAIGDIVLSGNEGGWIAHRVIAHDIRRAVLLTKGDACPRHDTPVPLCDVLGIVTGIMEKGRVRVPLRIRYPWSVLVAFFSRMQHQCRQSFPCVMESWDVFGFSFKLMEKIEQWKL